MLVLTRTKGEVVTIGDDITVMVVEVKGQKVRLGIEAPKSVAVHRAEIKKKIEQEGKQKRSKYFALRK